MSGLVVAYGEPRRSLLESAFKKIRHRGPHIDGIFQKKRVIMGQNYLEADGSSAHEAVEIPVPSSSNADLRICYDGQMGIWDELARTHGIPDGPLREERLCLHLYEQHGRGMTQWLTDAIFAFVISDGKDLFAARDLLGIKTLYYGWKDKTVYLASELKCIFEVTEEVYEFPPGHYMDRKGHLIRFAELPKTPPSEHHSNLDRIIKDIRAIILRSLRNRVDFRVPTGSLLSGGIDSSVITYLASDAYRKKFGKDTRLKTFALGVGESSDIFNGRVIATCIDTDHHELIVDLEEILKILPEVIYYLESFDPSLVRSAVSNFLISRYAREHGIQILLSGEGGDEIFCGYTYLKDFSGDELFARQMECIGSLHNNAALRLDRMNQCHSVRVVAPLISGELLNYAMAIPPEYKQRPEGNEKIEKWIFRKAFETFLPKGVVWRVKQEFSQGSGSASLLPAYFEEVISDEELATAQATYPMVRSREELYYFRIFTRHFGGQHAVETVGQWICL
jgi:asparagine synthase (glutamine-hydrolysing)